jgi:hypothetical protein
MIAALTPNRSPGATLTVTNNNDAGTGSLRQVVLDAVSGDTVTFATGVTGTITLTSVIALTNNLGILGPGANVLTVNGNGTTNLFNVTNCTVLVANLSLTGGHAAFGGAVQLTSGMLTISNCTISGNTAPPASGGRGGGIYAVSASLLVVNSTLSGNTALMGGAIYGDISAQLEVRNSTVTAILPSADRPRLAAASSTTAPAS